MAYGNAAGLAKAIENLVEIGVDRIFAHNKSLGEALIQGLEARNAQIISPRGDDERSSIVAARFPGHDPADVARGLGRTNVLVSLRKNFTRLSPHLYNNAEDIEKALQALDRILG
ncbi:MAG: aminotransferase class V-fold PLP-dependent enzyme [Proteobacteria bacterium]|nr:aminotransferase class V-fold PLP-dependent enzyme [Pseudomonadota bacterium]